MSLISDHAEILPTIAFEFRFARDSTKHITSLEARKRLVKDFAKGLAKPSVTHVELFQVERIGDSGSQVFYVDVFRRGLVSPESFVAKFQTLAATTHEARGAHTAQIVGMCPAIFCFPIEVQNAVSGDEKDTRKLTFPSELADVGMIVYRFTTVKHPREFRDAFLDLNVPAQACADALNILYSRVPSLAHLATEPITFVEDFEKYMRPGVDPLSRVMAMATSSHSGMQDLAKSVSSHLQFIWGWFNVPLQRVAVHGDLHARNLMIGGKEHWDYELIDFDWMHYGHPAKDFVVLEATLKYMLLPELLRKMKLASGAALPYLPINAIELLTRNWYLPGLEIPEDSFIEESLETVDLLKEHLAAIKRVNSCLRVLRARAKTCMQEYANLPSSPVERSAEQHYYASLFVVTVGLVGYTQTELMWSMIGLCRLGDHLRRTS